MPESPSAEAPPTRRWLWPLAAVFLVAFVVWMWNGPGGAKAASTMESFSIARKADGTWPEIPTEDAAFTWSLSAGSRATNTNRNTSMAKGTPEGARVMSRSVLVLNRSGDELTEAIAQRVIATLQQDPEVRHLSYSPLGKPLEVGSLAPNVIVNLETLAHTQDTLAGNGTSKTEVRAYVTDQVARSRVFRVAGKHTSRTVGFQLNITVSSDTKQSGFATPSSQLAATADDVAASILESLTGSIGDMRREHGEMPDLPAEFYPEFRPVDESTLPLKDFTSLQLLGSWHGMFLHNDTWWRGVATGTAEEAVARFAADMKAAGFRLDDEYDDTEMIFSKGTHVVRVFPDEVPPQIGDILEDPEPAQSATLFVNFREFATKDAMEQAIDLTLKEDASPTLLAVFAPTWTEAQRTRALELIDSRDLRTAENLFLRAKLRKDSDADAANTDLRRANWVAHASFSQEAMQKKVEDTAEDWEIEIDEGTAEELTSAGFLPLPEPGAEQEVEFGPETPARFFLVRTDKWPTTLVAVGVKRADSGEWLGAMRNVTGGMRSETSAMSVGSAHSTTIRNRHVTVSFTEIREDGSGRAKLKFGR